MNMINMSKNDEERKLRKAIYIGDEGQVTTVSGRSLSGGPDRSQEVPTEVKGSRAKPDTVTCSLPVTVRPQ